jgi:hypothetical protein
VQEEQERRRQAERDFLELMSSIEGDGGSEAGASGSMADGQQGASPAALASRRLYQLQVRAGVAGWRRGRAVRRDDPPCKPGGRKSTAVLSLLPGNSAGRAIW